MHEDARTIHDHFFQVSRQIRESGEEVLPMAFLLVPEGDQLGIIQIPVGLVAPDKDQAAALLRAAAQAHGARYVVHTAEGWYFEGDENQMRNATSVLLAGGALEHFPGRVEMLLSTMDGPSIVRILRCAIHEDGTLGPTDIQETDGKDAAGRFVNLSGHQDEESQGDPQNPPCA